MKKIPESDYNNSTLSLITNLEILINKHDLQIGNLVNCIVNFMKK